jgi:hypothetical protein
MASPPSRKRWSAMAARRPTASFGHRRLSQLLLGGGTRRTLEAAAWAVGVAH